MTQHTVAILGGGVGGMSAAHELIRRGFHVEVFERGAVPGGKARSMGVPSTGVGGRADLPGEHGFRFFPGFYRHLPNTMSHIQPDVTLRFQQTSQMAIAQSGGSALVMPTPLALAPLDLMNNLSKLFTPAWNLPPEDAAHFSGLLLQYLTSCDERRYGEYEYQSWWDFSDAQNRSDAFQKYCARGLTRTMVAASAEVISARTAVSILLQLLFDMATPGAQVDRVLDGPTNEVWIDPWLADLQQRGVVYHLDTKVVAIQCSGKHVTGVTVEDASGQRTVTADYYVAAMPTEVIRTLTAPLLVADPSLSSLDNLDVEWMNGIQFFLKNPIAHVHGHMIYIDSPWALTSVEQKQFWPQVDLSMYGDGSVKDVLSVDISNWKNAVGTAVGKPASNCSTAEIVTEVMAQLKAHLDQPSHVVLDPADVVAAHLDPDILYIPLPPLPPNFSPTPPAGPFNVEPLLINTKGSWFSRLEARTQLDNLFLAADFVRTHTDLATMEGANEAARRAVNAILLKSGSTAPLCRIWPLSEPAVYAPLRLADRVRYKLGLPYSPIFINLAKPLLPLWQLTQWVRSIGYRLQALASESFRRERVGPIDPRREGRQPR